MKKLIIKDKKKKKLFNRNETIKYILSLIINNLNVASAIRQNANKQLQTSVLKSSITTFNSRCKLTVNKKRFNKLTRYSRHIFLKLIRFGKINGFQKTSW